jgi:hypothetical protein
MDEAWKTERRLVLRLLGYWQQLRGTRSYPSLTEIDPAIIAADWPDCVLIQRRDPATLSTYRHVGHRLLPPDWASQEGQPISDTPKGTLLQPATAFMSMVLAKEVPISIGGQYDTIGKGPVLYRAILMPLSSDGRTIDGLFGGTNCRPADLQGPTVVGGGADTTSDTSMGA